MSRLRLFIVLLLALGPTLAAAQKPYDLLIFPEERHMPRDAQGLEYQERRVIGYFQEHL